MLLVFPIVPVAAASAASSLFLVFFRSSVYGLVLYFSVFASSVSVPITRNVLVDIVVFVAIMVEP